MKDKDTEYAKKLAKDLSKSIKQQKLVIFVGAGVSISQGYPNWDNYIEHLIKYWQGQILAESDEKKLGREHHLIFDLISKSDISNKRKVDLVNYELKNVFGEDFEKRRLDFERGYFKNLLPYSLVNPVLESLASLDAIFITSNYDYEIENHAKRLKNTVVTINDLNEFQHNKKGKLQFGDVLHIHGTPDCDIEYFVSSSADYSKTYLKGRNNFNKLVNWFKKTKPTVLFIGASLEEDEILSLLHEGSQNYALMKSENTGNSKVDEHYKKIVEGFFNSENHTQIIWYGDKFKDLPIFVERLVSDINKELGVHEFHSEWNNLLNPSREQEQYNQSLDNISNDSHYLTSLVNKVIEINNNDLDNLLLKGILQGETLEKIRSGSFPVFWKFIAENIEKLNDDEWETIYGILIQGNQRCFMDDMYKVYCQAIENNLFDNKQVNELRKVLARDRDVINSSFNQDNTLLGYWFVNSFEYSNDYLYITDDQEIEVNLNSDCVKQLSQILSSSQHFNYY
ncbi:SIR2 family protein, partial [Streptococcus mutans]|nr:SIR2 family protein [Streptococcus mutans]